MKRLSLILLLILLVGCTTAQRGDKLQVVYTGAFENGTIFDTNDPANVGAFVAPSDHFQPLEVTLGKGQLIKGFEDALYNMKEGEKKEIKIKAADAYGTYDASKVIPIPKHFVVPQKVELRRELSIEKKEFKDNVTIGKIIHTQNFNYNVTGINATHIALYMVNASSDPLLFEDTYWNSTLVHADHNIFTYSSLITENKTYMTKFGPYAAQFNGTHYVFTTTLKMGDELRTPTGVIRIDRETPDNLYADLNHPLAGQNLLFNVTVKSITKQDKP